MEQRLLLGRRATARLACRLLPLLLLATARGTAGEPTAPRSAAPAGAWAEIRVVDADTGRGVPLAELRTVHGLLFVTDDAGRVAFQEPGLLDRPVYFHLRAHGYEIPPDGFGFRGRRVVPRAGAAVTIGIPRRDVAERLGRLTGEGRFRDSILLGHVAAPDRPPPGGVAGQDSVQAVPYRGRVHWFWGDTARISYPLGLFRTCGATTAPPDPNDPASDPAHGLPFQYFTAPPDDAEPQGFVRAMMPLPERPEGVIWIDGVCVVPDAAGRERMVAHYSRRRGLPEELEQGIAVWDDATESFVVARRLPLEEGWRRPSSHPLVVEEPAEGGGTRRMVLFGAPDEFWGGLKAGRSGIDYLSNPAEYENITPPVNFGGQIKNFNIEKYFSDPRQVRGFNKDMDNVSQFAVVAAKLAIEDSGIDFDKLEEWGSDRTRVATFVGTGIGGIKTTCDDFNTLNTRGLKALGLRSIIRLMPNAPSGHIGILWGLQGRAKSDATACASGLDSIFDAYWYIKNGLADAMVTGGTESCL
ncbi:MAG: beta-ketoacyl synthase N-terminal-like domain-containing protein, partial [Planctomycetaceae bacterium]